MDLTGKLCGSIGGSSQVSLVRGLKVCSCCERDLYTQLSEQGPRGSQREEVGVISACRSPARESASQGGLPLKSLMKR